MSIEFFDANMSDLDRKDGERLVHVRTTNAMNELYFWCDDLEDEELVDEIKSALRRKYGRRGGDMYLGYDDVPDVFLDEDGNEL
jgi:hypothetical protein